jgi:hypothetical protein
MRDQWGLQLPGATGHILLTVYDVSGRRIRTLIDAVKFAGAHVAV